MKWLVTGSGRKTGNLGRSYQIDCILTADSDTPPEQLKEQGRMALYRAGYEHVFVTSIQPTVGENADD